MSVSPCVRVNGVDAKSLRFPRREANIAIQHDDLIAFGAFFTPIQGNAHGLGAARPMPAIVAASGARRLILRRLHHPLVVADRIVSTDRVQVRQGCSVARLDSNLRFSALPATRVAARW